MVNNHINYANSTPFSTFSGGAWIPRWQCPFLASVFTLGSDPSCMLPKLVLCYIPKSIIQLSAHWNTFFLSVKYTMTCSVTIFHCHTVTRHVRTSTNRLFHQKVKYISTPIRPYQCEKIKLIHLIIFKNHLHLMANEENTKEIMSVKEFVCLIRNHQCWA